MEKQRDRGSLKIFFGYAGENGKTYRMLKKACEEKRRGIDVVVGYLTAGYLWSAETAPGELEILPTLEFTHGEETVRELYLDFAIRRNPELIIIEDLAHSNSKGCRHKKRYQDVMELLNKGIDVYTTLDVQNIESLNDIITSVTGEVPSERVPDFVFDGADQVELVDVPPKETGKRKRGNKKTVHVQTPYSEEMITTLHRIAQRRYEERENGKNGSFTEEHILVCLSPVPSNTKIIRTAARMAHAFRGTFTALYVESSDDKAMDERSRERLKENMHLAKQLGAETEIVYGDDVPFQIAEFSRLSGVTKVVMGRSAKTRTHFLKKLTFVDRLLMHAPQLDVYIIPDQEKKISAYRSKLAKDWFVFSPVDIIKSVGILVLASILGFLFDWLGFAEANIITVYVLAVLVISVVANNKVYSLISSIVSVLVFNFLFTDPKLTLQAYDRGYPVTFVVMFIAAFLTGTLATKLKSNAKMSAQAAFRTKILFDTNQLMQQAQNDQEILTETARQILRLLGRTIIVYPVIKEQLKEPMFFAADETESIEMYQQEEEKKVAEWVMKNNTHAGTTTQTFSNAKCLYLAIRIKNSVYGVVGIEIGCQSIDAYENSILLSILGECALALENRKNAIEKEEVAVLAKNEQLRANLLRAISHDLRTPLTSISGNASNLLYNGESFDSATKRSLCQDIYDDSMWLINLVENLLSVTRLEEGRLNIHISVELVDEVVKEALRHVNRLKTDHRISVKHEEDLLLAKMDARLIVQVLINLIDNAIKYTPDNSNIIIRTHRQGRWAVISVLDDGPGIPDENKPQVFDMFYSGANHVADSRRSLGVGLALCKSIVNAHGGTINVKDNSPQGTVFTFTLPIEEVELNEQTVNFSC